MLRSAGSLTLMALLAALLGCGDGGGQPRRASSAPVASAQPSSPLASGAASGYNLLLVSFDTTRADHMGHAGRAGNPTPTVDRLAASGVCFIHAYAPAPMTLPSHASLLTGLYPPTHGVRANGEFRLGDDATTLAELLAAGGYETAAFVASFVLDARFGLAQGFERYDFRADNEGQTGAGQEPERSARAVTDAAVAWLADRRPDRPFLLWVHYFDPHFPYQPPPEIARRFPSSPYLAEIAATDAELGRLLAAVERSAGGARTLVAVVGDHGESLGEHDELLHSRTIYEGAVRVPFVISAPGAVASGVTADGAAVSLVDVAPTLLDLLGLLEPATAAAMEGRSLCGLALDPQRIVYLETMGTYLSSGWAPLYGAARVDAKYILAPRPELYELGADPHEQRNLLLPDAAGEPAAVGNELRAFLDAYLADKPGPAEVAAHAAPMDAETRAQLEALGYLGTEDRGSVVGELPDPKDMLPLHHLYDEARTALGDGRPELAEARARELLAHSARDRAALSLLGEACLRLERYPEAEAAFRSRLELREDGLTLAFLANALMLQDRLDEAEAVLDRAQASFPDEGAVHFARGDLLLLQRRPAEATSAYQRAARVDPQRFRAKAEARIRQLRRMLAGS